MTKNVNAKVWDLYRWTDGSVHSKPQPLVYETLFSATENPISESGVWVNGNQYGAPYGGVQVTGGSPNGLAYSDHLIGTAFTDSIAFIDPDLLYFGPNHYVEIEVLRVGGYTPPSSQEIQLHLRASGKGTALRPLYEVLIPFGGTNGQIIVQDGTLGGYTDLGAAGSGWGAAPADGDCFRAEIIGSAINLYYKPSGGAYGASVMNVTNGAITAGQPGMGFYTVSGSGADPTKFCAKRFKCGPL